MIDVYSWPTPNGHKVHIMLEECGLPWRVHAVDIGKGDQFTPDFLAEVSDAPELSRSPLNPRRSGESVHAPALRSVRPATPRRASAVPASSRG